MIRPQSYLIVADNSGAKELMCIRVLGGSTQKYGTIGDEIIAVVKDAIPNMPVKRSDVNAAVIVNKEGNPRGTRVFGPIARELREGNFTKIVSLAPEVVSNENLFHWFFCSNHSITPCVLQLLLQHS